MIRSNSRFAHRTYTKASVALYKRTEVIDEVGVPNEVYSLVAIAPASVRQPSAYRSTQYLQIGLVDMVVIRFRKTCDAFDRMVIVNYATEAPETATNDDINSLREVTITARTGFDLARMGDEVTVEGKMGDEGHDKH